MPPKVLNISAWKGFLSKEVRNGDDDQEITRRKSTEGGNIGFTIWEIGN